MFSAAILSGGRASRFGGRDKGALVVGGRSILDRQLHELSLVADDVLFVGRAASGLEPGQVRSVEDRVAGQGPLGGLDAALAAARFETVVLLACDMPFVTGPLLQYLASLTDVTGSDAVVPDTEHGYHPLCAAYRRTCHAVVMRRLAEGKLAMKGLLEDRDVRLRVVSSEEIASFGDPTRLLANVNTPAALHGIEALQSHET